MEGGYRFTQDKFIVLTFILIVVIILLSRTLQEAVLLVTMVTGFVITATYINNIGRGLPKGRAPVAPGGGGAAPPTGKARPGPGPPVDAGGVVAATAPVMSTFVGAPADGGDSQAGGDWPGGLSDSEMQGILRSSAPDTNETYTYGLPPLDEKRGPFGNPFDLNNVYTPGQHSMADGTFDEARVALDGDERLAMQGRFRNDPYRVAAGIMRRKDLVDRNVREELDREEDSRWWGRWDL
ncbi:MAG: hypothetical protein P1U53_11150 [Sulfitobacter sp.]|nr:hypothetical protein [Sulfitobacter sp.]